MIIAIDNYVCTYTNIASYTRVYKNTRMYEYSVACTHVYFLIYTHVCSHSTTYATCVTHV